MGEEQRDERWQEILEAQADFVDQPEPLHVVGKDGARRRASSKSEQFNEALSALGSWSSVEQPRRRLSA